MSHDDVECLQGMDPEYTPARIGFISHSGDWLQWCGQARPPPPVSVGS